MDKALSLSRVDALKAGIALLLGLGALAAASLGSARASEHAAPEYCQGPALAASTYAVGEEDGLDIAGGAVASNLVHTAGEPTVAAYIDPYLPTTSDVVHELNCTVVVPVEDLVDELLGL